MDFEKHVSIYMYMYVYSFQSSWKTSQLHDLLSYQFLIPVLIPPLLHKPAFY